MGVVLRAANIVSTVMLVCGLLMWIRGPNGESALVVLNIALLLLMAAPAFWLMDAVAEELRAREWGFAALGIMTLALLCGSLIVALNG